MNMPDVSLIIPLASLLCITPEELLDGKDRQSSPSPDLADPERPLPISSKPYLKKTRLVILILFCISVPVLLDAIYGYSLSLIQWTANNKEFMPHGLVFKMILGFGSLTNYSGAILSKMLMILMIISALTIILLMILLILRNYSPKRNGSHRSS